MSAEKTQGVARAPAPGQPVRASSSFPFKLLTVALLLTAAILAGLGWQARSAYRGFETMHVEHARLQKLTGVIDRLDEVLTMSVQRAAETGDAKWERQHRIQAPKLDAMIGEVKHLAPAWRAGEAAKQIEEANARLVEMEKQALELVARDDREAALEILAGGEYRRQKAAYANGLDEIGKNVSEHVAAEFEARRRGAGYAAAAASVALPVLLLGWFVALRMVRKNMAERERGAAALRDTDVTAREKAEAALLETEELYRTLVENVNIGVYRNTGGPHGRFLRANPAIARMFGYDTVEEFMTVHVSDLYQDPEERKAFVEEALTRGFVKDQELRLKRQDGTAIWASCTAKIKFDEKGGILWFDGVIEDITERKQAEQALRESEERYRALFEGAAEGILIADAETRGFKYANPAICSMLGYTEEELAQLAVDDLRPKEALEAVLAHFEAQMAGRERLAAEIPCLRKDGAVFYADVDATPAAVDGAPCVVGFFRDVTDRRRAEEEIRSLNADLEQRVAERTAELRASEENYRALAESAQEFIFTVDRDSHIQYANTYMARQVRRTPETVIGKSIKDILPRSAALTLEHHLQSVYKSDQPVAVEEEMTLTEPASKPLCLDMRLVPLRDENGGITAVLAIAHDITRRKEAEEAVRESEERYRGVVEDQTEYITRFRSDGTMTFLNRACAHLLDKDPEELIGHNVFSYMPDEDVKRLKAQLASLGPENPAATIEHKVPVPDGSVLWQRWTNRAIFDDAGRCVEYQGVGSDVTEQKNAEEALRRSEERLRSIFDNALVGIYRTTPDGRILLANPALVSMLGFESFEKLAQRNLDEQGYEPEYSRREFRERMERDGQVVGLETAWARRDGTSVYVRESATAVRDDAGDILYYEGTVEDVTARKRAEEALRVAARDWQATFDALSSSVCLLSMDGTIQQCNEAMAEFVGKTPAEVEGCTCWELVHSSTEPVENCPFVRAKESGHKETMVFRVGGRWLDVSVDPVLDEDGRMTAAVHVVSDITDRRRAEEAVRESEERYRTLAETAEESIFIIGSDLTVQYVNTFGATQAGCAADELIGKNVAAVFPPDTAARLAENLRTVFESGAAASHENVIRFAGRPDVDIWLDTHLTPLRDERGAVYAVLGISRDVTERKRAGEALRDSEQRLRNVYETAPLAFVIWDTDLNVTGWNERAEQVFGWTQEEAGGRNIFDLIIPEHERPDIREVVDSLLRGELLTRHINDNITKAGDIITCEWSNSVLRDREGNVAGVMSLALDITDRKRAEEALRDSEARYRAIFGQAIDSVVLFDPDTGAIMEFNDAAHENLGYTREEFGKLSLVDIDAVETPDEVRKHIEDIAAGKSTVFETKHRRKDGDIRDVQVNSGTVVVRDKPLLLSIWRDVTEAKHSRERIERQAAILANVTDAVAVARDDRTVIYWNKGAEQMFGFTEAEMLGRTGLDELLRSPGQAEELANEILSTVDREGGYTQNRLPCRHKDGQDMWAHITASRIKAEPDQPASVLLVARDVTEEVQLHERLIRSERLAAIGTLASGVAHEMNNLLGGLRGLSDLAAGDEAVIPRLIDSARTVAERGGAITARLTSLASADQPGADRRVDLPTSVLTAIHMVKPLFGQRNITVEEHYGPTPPTWINEGKIFQVLLNLFVNACDSIGRDGTIRVAAEHDDKSDELVITVNDTGAGIRPEDVPRLFDPFFTTKRGGGPADEPSHLGLGLPESRDIVRSYGGDIDVVSLLGHGATFTIRLPVRSSPTAPLSPLPAAETMPEKGSPMLVVDDDPLMRFWLTRHLEEQGYKVTAVDNGRDAVAAFGKISFPYVFLDLLMPGELDGAATLRKLKDARPDTRVIIISAFARDTIEPDCLEAAHAVLKKPFGVDDLARAFAGKSTPA